MFKLYSKFSYVFLAVVTLTACSQISLTQQEKLDLEKLRQDYMKISPAEKEKYATDPDFSLLQNIILNDTVQSAKNSAKTGNLRPISLAMGYHATANDAKIFGLECSKTMKTIPTVSGCMPPPPFIMKLYAQYNMTLIKQPNFPAEAKCTPVLTLIKDLNAYSAEFYKDRH